MSTHTLCITVDDDTMRDDIVSPDVDRVYPELQRCTNARKRMLEECDAVAYNTIKDRFPRFVPPHQAVATPTDRPVAESAHGQSDCND